MYYNIYIYIHVIIYRFTNEKNNNTKRGSNDTIKYHLDPLDQYFDIKYQ